jgi:hypothetical protein
LKEERKQSQKEVRRIRLARYRAEKEIEWETMQRENAALRQLVLETETTMKAVLDHLLVNHPDQWLDVQSIVHQGTTEEPPTNALWDENLFGDVMANADWPNIEFEGGLDCLDDRHRPYGAKTERRAKTESERSAKDTFGTIQGHKEDRVGGYAEGECGASAAGVGNRNDYESCGIPFAGKPP